MTTSPKVPRTPLNLLEKKITAKISQASLDFNLLQPDDSILVCLSGGKDSYTLYDRLQAIRAKLPFNINLVAFHLDQNQPGYPKGIMETYLQSQPFPYEIADVDTYSAVQELIPEGNTPCSLCSRLRRGIIYTAAERLGCNKIALGHHRDDSIETLLLNMFHSGQIQAMPASYTTDDGRFQVIRPMIYVPESLIIEYAEQMQFPIIPCNLCGSLEGRRKAMAALLDNLESTIPDIRNSLLAAMTNVRTTHLLDRRLLPSQHAPQEPSPTHDPQSPNTILP